MDGEGRNYLTGSIMLSRNEDGQFSGGVLCKVRDRGGWFDRLL